MTEAQREKALVLMRTGTSAEGAKTAETIMSLESVLHQMEGGKGNVRNPNWYFVSIYGEPGTDSWGWRFEGHHLSLNFTLKGDQVVSVTPRCLPRTLLRFEVVQEKDKKRLRKYRIWHWS